MRLTSFSARLATLAALVCAVSVVLLLTLYSDLAGIVFLGSVAVLFLSSLAAGFANRRYLLLTLGSAAAATGVGCGIAFLQLWAIADSAPSGGSGLPVKADPDPYFYLAGLAFLAMLALLYLAAVLPRRQARRPAAKRPGTAKRPTPRATARR